MMTAGFRQQPRGYFSNVYADPKVAGTRLHPEHGRNLNRSMAGKEF